MSVGEWLEFVRDQRHICIDLEQNLGVKSVREGRAFAQYSSADNLSSEFPKHDMPLASSERKRFLFS